MSIFLFLLLLHLLQRIHISKSLHIALVFLALLQNSYSLELVSSLRNESEIIERNVTLNKCPEAKITESFLEVEAKFIFGYRFSNDSGKIYVFRLNEAEPECSESNEFIVKLKNQDAETGERESERSFSEKSIETSEAKIHYGVPVEQYKFEINLDGTLSAQFGDLRQSYFDIGDYCIQKLSKSEIVFLFCNESEICKRRPCIKKCCPLHQVVSNKQNFKCQDSGPLVWKPLIHEDINSTDHLSDKETEDRGVKPHLYYHNSKSPLNDKNCTDYIKTIHEKLSEHSENFPEYEEFSNFKILTDGSIFDENVSPGVPRLQQDEFCIDGIQDYGKGESYSGEHSTNLVYYECADDPDETTLPDDIVAGHQNPDQTHEIVFYLVIVPFASLFLILTIIIYILVWDMHNIHGRNLFCYVCSLLGFYICLFLSRIFSNNMYDIHEACALTGVGIHFFFLATACWLTVISFDIWWTFRKLKAGGASQNLRKFIAYSLFAFGIPVTIVSISYTIDSSYENSETAPIIVPEYGARMACALSNESLGYYVYTPIGILLCFNLGFFIGTIVTLVNYQRSIRSALDRSSTNKEDQSYGNISDLKIKRFTRYKISAGCRQLNLTCYKSTVGLRVYLKIFVATGSTWILEIVGWAMKRDIKDSTIVDVIVAVIDIFNILLAVAIFFIFVWRPNIFDRLWQKYPCLRPILSLCILGTCCTTPQSDRHRPSYSAMTMSTLGRNGTLASTRRKLSRDSVLEMVENKQRKLSAVSTTSSGLSNLRNSNLSDSANDLVGGGRQRKFSAGSRTSSTLSNPRNSNDLFNDLAGDRQRKLSAASRTSSIPSNPRTSSSLGMSTLLEDVEEGDGDAESQLIDTKINKEDTTVCTKNFA